YILPYHVILPAYIQMLDLHSFPTRRSYDLTSLMTMMYWLPMIQQQKYIGISRPAKVILYDWALDMGNLINRSFNNNYLLPNLGRSEEHTSELQSRFDLVCRLLLEKKNTIIF